MYNNKIIWFTGLSGAGKSTLANTLLKSLNKKKFKCKIIDGDQFRKEKKYKNSFTKKEIIKNNNLIIGRISKIYKFYDFTLVSVISPLKSTRLKAKKKFGDSYIEIFVYCGIKELIRRDTKGLYKLAKAKKINNLIGYNSKVKYEKTNYKKLIVNTKLKNINETLKNIKKNLKIKFDCKI